MIVKSMWMRDAMYTWCGTGIMDGMEVAAEISIPCHYMFLEDLKDCWKVFDRRFHRNSCWQVSLHALSEVSRKKEMRGNAAFSCWVMQGRRIFSAFVVCIQQIPLFPLQQLLQCLQRQLWRGWHWKRRCVDHDAGLRGKRTDRHRPRLLVCRGVSWVFANSSGG